MEKHKVLWISAKQKNFLILFAWQNDKNFNMHRQIAISLLELITSLLATHSALTHSRKPTSNPFLSSSLICDAKKPSGSFVWTSKILWHFCVRKRETFLISWQGKYENVPQTKESGIFNYSPSRAFSEVLCFLRSFSKFYALFHREHFHRFASIFQCEWD